MEFNGKSIIITGGANGIGRCIAESFLNNGAYVFIIDNDKTAGELLLSKFDRLQFFHGNIAEKVVLEKFIDKLDDNNNKIYALINNACISRNGLLSNCSYEDFEYVQKVGVIAPYYLTSLLLQRDLFEANASIVNISSTRASQSQENTESYSAAKGGIAALTHAMSISLAGKVRVNSISPGWIDTAAYHNKELAKYSTADKVQHPAGRVGRPTDIAEMVLYLCSEKASFIDGENISIDGGMSHLMIYHNDNNWQYNK